MRATWAASLVVVGGLVAWPRLAFAQPLFSHAESIESAVINADLVVIAKLVNVARAQRVDGREFHDAVIDIEQNLKKELFGAEPVRRRQIQLPHPAATLADWKQRGCRLLVAHDEQAPETTMAIELAPGKMEVLTADFTLLRDPDAVIQAAKDALRELPPAVKRIHTVPLKVPGTVVAGTEWEKYYKTGGGVSLFVPVDQRLEKRAEDYIRSDQYLTRKEGAMAIRFFKSAQNIERVKKLLDDPGWAYLRHAEVNNGVEVRLYGVREEAFRTLTYWDVNVPMPLIREEVLK